jgi:hypothetical protein
MDIMAGFDFGSSTGVGGIVGALDIPIGKRKIKTNCAVSGTFTYPGRHQQIPTDQGERSDVAGLHRLFLLQARIVGGVEILSIAGPMVKAFLLRRKGL